MRFLLTAALICGMTASGVSASWAQRRSSPAATESIARTSPLGTAPTSANVFGLNHQGAGATQINQGVVSPAPCPGGSSNGKTLATFDGGGMMVPSISTIPGTSSASTMPGTPSAMSGTSGSDACGSRHRPSLPLQPPPLRQRARTRQCLPPRHCLACRQHLGSQERQVARRPGTP